MNQTQRGEQGRPYNLSGRGEGSSLSKTEVSGQTKTTILRENKERHSKRKEYVVGLRRDSETSRSGG